MPYVDCDSARIFYSTAGENELAIVFVHGFGCSHVDWSHQADYFSSRYRTVALDLRCHGKSAGNPSDCTIERLSDDVVCLLSDLNASRYILVGHSLGCRIVIEAAVRAAATVAGVVLVDGNCFGDASVTNEQFLNYLRTRGHHSVLIGLFSQMFGVQSPERDKTRLLAGIRKISAELIETVLVSNMTWERSRMTSLMSRLHSPVLALQSTTTDAQHRRVPLLPGASTPWLEAISIGVSDTTIRRIHDAGHFPMLDQPVATNNGIQDFVNRIVDVPINL
jgi:pimeloyl-ACP methyl ester carboxylesterase